jgi:hypothetical protein
MGPGDPSDPYLDPSVPPWDMGGPAPFDASVAGPPPADPFAGLPPAPEHWYADQSQQTPMGAPVDPYGAPVDMGQSGLGPEAAPPLAQPPGSAGGFPDVSFGTDAPPDLSGPAPSAPQLGGWNVGGQSAPPIPAQLPSELPPPPAAPGTQLPPGIAGPTITGPEAQYRQSVQDAHGDPFAIQSEPDRQRYLDESSRLRPEEFAGLQADYLQRRDQYVNDRRKRLLADDEEAQRQNYEDRKAADEATEQKVAAVQEDAKRILNTKIDRTGGMSTFSKLAYIAGAIVGGMVQGRTGASRNAGMDAINEAIKQGIAAQEGDLQRQKEGVSMRLGELGREYARHGDELRSKEALRQAAYSHMDELLATEAQNFDARSKSALNLAATRSGISAARQKSLLDFAIQERKRNLEERNLRREEALAASTIAKNSAETSRLYAESRNAKAVDQVWDPKQLGVLNPGLPTPPIAMTQKAYNQWLDTQKTGQQALTAARANDPNERARELAVSGVVDDRGAPVLYSDKNVQTVRDAVQTSSEILRLTDDLIGMVEQSGGSSSIVKDPEFRKKVQNYNSIIIQQKERDKLGVLTGPDVGIVTGEIGTADPTEWRSGQALEALKHFRHNVVEGTNTAIQKQAVLPEGRRVQRWEPVNPATLAPPKATTEDRAKKMVLGDPLDAQLKQFTPSGDVRSAEDAPTVGQFADRLSRERYGKPAVQLSPLGLSNITQEAARALTARGIELQKQQIDAWGQALRSGTPEERAAAARALAEAAGDEHNRGASTSVVRKYAQQAILNSSVEPGEAR